jgi:pyruvate formate lyase activating enzyme
MSADEVLAKALRYKAYWGAEGGITVSGGEPLLQLEFLTELFEKAKRRGVRTCIDTAAGPLTREEPWFGKFRKLMDATDLLLLDLKHIDPAAHKALTGADNANALDCAKYLSETGKPVWIRHVLVPGVNTDEPSLAKLGAFIRTLTNVKKVEVLPYHSLGVQKWKTLGIPYALEGVEPPSADQLAKARALLV